MRFSDYIRSIRIVKGKTLETIAKQLGVTRQFISQIELGHYRPNAEMVDKLAAVLGVDKIDAHIKANTISPEYYDKFVQYQKELIKVVDTLEKAKGIMKGNKYGKVGL